MIRPGLFVSMNTDDVVNKKSGEKEDTIKRLNEIELTFKEKDNLCDYCYEIIHKFRVNNMKERNNISLIINII